MILLTYVEPQTVVGTKQFGRSSQFGARKRVPNCDDPPKRLVSFIHPLVLKRRWIDVNYCWLMHVFRHRFTFIEKEQLSFLDMSLPGKMEPYVNGTIVFLLTRKLNRHWHNEVSRKWHSPGHCLENTFVWKTESHIDINATEICSHGSNWQWVSIDTEDVLKPLNDNLLSRQVLTQCTCIYIYSNI